ncbi:MAG: hypothetical protein ACXVBX_15345, partial [Flavisolibacter sp.]
LGLFFCDHSQFTIHNSPFAIHHSRFTIEHSPLTIDHSPLTTLVKLTNVIDRNKVFLYSCNYSETYFPISLGHVFNLPFFNPSTGTL